MQYTPHDLDLYLTTNELASLMRVSTTSIFTMINRRQIRYHKPFGRVLIEKQYAMSLIHQRTNQTKDEIEREIAKVFALSLSKTQKDGKNET